MSTDALLLQLKDGVINQMPGILFGFGLFAVCYIFYMWGLEDEIKKYGQNTKVRPFYKVLCMSGVFVWIVIFFLAYHIAVNQNREMKEEAHTAYEKRVLEFANEKWQLNGLAMMRVSTEEQTKQALEKGAFLAATRNVTYEDEDYSKVVHDRFVTPLKVIIFNIPGSLHAYNALLGTEKTVGAVLGKEIDTALFSWAKLCQLWNACWFFWLTSGLFAHCYITWNECPSTTAKRTCFGCIDFIVRMIRLVFSITTFGMAARSCPMGEQRGTSVYVPPVVENYFNLRSPGWLACQSGRELDLCVHKNCVPK